jgi:hypothetical protein
MIFSNQLKFPAGMLKRLLLLLLCIAVHPLFVNADPLDSVTVEKLAEKVQKSVVATINNQTRIVKDSMPTAIKGEKFTGLAVNMTISGFIVFLPISLFIIILFSTFLKLKKEKIQLGDFLVDKDVKVAIQKEETAVSIANTQAIAANAAKVTPVANPDQQTLDNSDQSVSRLVAFISGITSVSLAVCITSYYFYRSFLGHENVDISNLSNVLYGLGLGVLPYGFNKISNAIK